MNSVSSMHSRVQTRLKQTLISSCSIISNQRCTTKHYLLWQFTMSLCSDHSGALAADCLRRAICCWFVTTSTKKTKINLGKFSGTQNHPAVSVRICNQVGSCGAYWVAIIFGVLTEILPGRDFSSGILHNFRADGLQFSLSSTDISNCLSQQILAPTPDPTTSDVLLPFHTSRIASNNIHWQ